MIIPTIPTTAKLQKENSFNKEDIRTYPSFLSFKNRFLSYIPKHYFLKENEDICWKWTRSFTGNGYGQITWGRKLYPAHRISYLIFNGFIPINKVIMHTCDNPKCINPKHLVLGTQYNNIIDSINKRKHYKTVLNEEAVKVIKWMLKHQNYHGLSKKLASLYGVNQSRIAMIKNNNSWSWVKV